METLAGAGVPCRAMLDSSEVLGDPDLHEGGTLLGLDAAARGRAGQRPHPRPRHLISQRDTIALGKVAMTTGLKQKLDYSDYVHIPPDRSRWEILDGELYVTPAPTPLHQRVSRRLQRQLEDYFHARSLGEVFNAPIDVIITQHDVVQPDLVLVTDPRQVSARGIEGTPTLLVEVLSPSTREYDQTAKAQRYASLGVSNFWVVDPEAHRVQCFRADAGRYTLVVEGAGKAPLAHPDWPDLTLALADLWR